MWPLAAFASTEEENRVALSIFGDQIKFPWGMGIVGSMIKYCIESSVRFKPLFLVPDRPIKSLAYHK
jgi:hypothetical protein